MIAIKVDLKKSEVIEGKGDIRNISRIDAKEDFVAMHFRKPFKRCPVVTAGIEGSQSMTILKVTESSIEFLASPIGGYAHLLVIGWDHEDQE